MSVVLEKQRSKSPLAPSLLRALPIDISALLSGSLVESERIELKEGWNSESVLHTLCATPIDAGEPILVSSSMGLITWDVGIGPRELVVHADEALQQARAAGKNRIAVWGDDARSNGLLSR